VRHLVIALAMFLSSCGLREIDHNGHAVTTSRDADKSNDRVPDAGVRPARDASVSPGTVADAAVDPPLDAAVSGEPGPGVTIAGRFVPRAKAIVLLHIGHSNMAGRASTPAALEPYFYDPDPQLWTYKKGGAFSQAREPTAPDNEAGQAAGPGMALLRSAKEIAPPDAAIISIGHGHSGSFGGYCSAFRKGGLLYDIVMAPARELRGKVTFAGIFTMLGQSEHNAPPAEQAMFAQCLAGIAADMRGDLDEPELPFLVGDYEQGISRSDIAPSSPFGKKTIAQIQMVPDLVTTSAIIPTVGCTMQDDHHFDLGGHKMWATSAIQLLVDRKWAAWAR
jgi:hypothetical protein